MRRSQREEVTRLFAHCPSHVRADHNTVFFSNIRNGTYRNTEKMLLTTHRPRQLSCINCSFLESLGFHFRTFLTPLQSVYDSFLDTGQVRPCISSSLLHSVSFHFFLASPTAERAGFGRRRSGTNATHKHQHHTPSHPSRRTVFTVH